MQRPVIVIAVDMDDANKAMVAPGTRKVAVTPRNMRWAGRGCSAAAIVVTDRAREHARYADMLATTVPCILA